MISANVSTTASPFPLSFPLAPLAPLAFEVVAFDDVEASTAVFCAGCVDANFRIPLPAVAAVRLACLAGLTAAAPAPSPGGGPNRAIAPFGGGPAGGGPSRATAPLVGGAGGGGPSRATALFVGSPAGGPNRATALFRSGSFGAPRFRTTTSAAPLLVAVELAEYRSKIAEPRAPPLPSRAVESPVESARVPPPATALPAPPW
mmetsp:Transcript_88018/g.251148  ORF Transcript_88018/g.251148 Transcript_88018/m.251148 type:complete len:203 (+) Transcript_88018:637-1245(+)